MDQQETIVRFVRIADFEQQLEALPAPDAAAEAAARAHQARLTKPPGALGRLEDMACFIAGWQGTGRPVVARPHVLVFAGNHGVAARGVSPYPAEVTAQMVENFSRGGAAINALAGSVGLPLSVIALDLDQPTADFTQAPAMSEAACLAALNRGAASLPEQCDFLCLGEMGIGNSTVAAALAAALFGGSGADWAGPGTGLDETGIARKAAVIDAALERHRAHAGSAFTLLQHLGGREQAAIAGAVLAARLRRIPVLLDGFVAAAAAAVLLRDNAAALAHCLAGHRSAEPAHGRLLAAAGLEPLLDLGMRLGEGTGAALAFGLIRAALAAHNGMASFEEARVSGRKDGA